ncbi:MAG: uracil-DNA glycosylase [Chloroflexi bacterium]|nr:uracil-DNA glycosylase [Chloroflexota bacterium]
MRALAGQIHSCRRCPRLVAWRAEAALTKRAAYRDETYWGRPVAGFGDPQARVVLVGLAPAAHGGNRTGRVFTGDRSGDFLFGALHRAGFANQAESRQRDDGLELQDAFVTAIVRCAPPANRPTAQERVECQQWLEAELDLLPQARVAVALGGEAWRQLLRVFRERGLAVPRPAPRFGHGAEAAIGSWTLLGAYHPSQQNTFTGRLTPAMLDDVLIRARELACDSA